MDLLSQKRDTRQSLYNHIHGIGQNGSEETYLKCVFITILNWWEVDALKMLSRWAYLLHIEEYPESFEQLSNELLQCSFACMANIKQLGMIKGE